MGDKELCLLYNNEERKLGIWSDGKLSKWRETVYWIPAYLPLREIYLNEGDPTIMAREGASSTFRKYRKQATGGEDSAGLIREELRRLALYDREWRVTVVVPIIHGRPARLTSSLSFPR